VIKQRVWCDVEGLSAASSSLPAEGYAGGKLQVDSCGVRTWAHFEHGKKPDEGNRCGAA